MMKKIFSGKYCMILFILTAIFSCSSPADISLNGKGQPVYTDEPYLQDYSVQYYLSDDQPDKMLFNVSADRNNHINILSDKGILVPDNGSLFYAGRLIRARAYSPMLAKNIRAITTYRNHTVYLDDQHIFSNAWAGRIQISHELPGAKIFAGSENFHFLVSDGEKLVYVNEAGRQLWQGSMKGVKKIRYDDAGRRFILVTPGQVAELTSSGSINILYEGTTINCAEPLGSGKIAIATSGGYIIYPDGHLIADTPHPDINCVKLIGGALWFGTTHGAFKLGEDGRYSYYAGQRWLPGNNVVALHEGPDRSILAVTDKGLGHIIFKEMTLEEKAMFFEQQVREKNIRYGFNCSQSRLPLGYSTAEMGPQPSDNLWTAMYMASQLFRYKVTGSEDARINAYEAFEAMERLHNITGIRGLFARSFERDYKVENTKTPGWEVRELASGSPATIWLPGADHANWTWRSTASSDQAVGQVFALTMILELADDEEWKRRALSILDNLMSYIVDNDLYIIDVDGEPTMWGKWNPDYVNSFPESVGDRRLYSSNIIAFLQTAYHFTGKEKYREKAYELMENYSYLDNLMRPISVIGPAKGDIWSETLSKEWNHSDDQMYFLGYWGLYPYAFTPELKEQYRETIRDHWNIERPEKNALWNIIYAMTGAKDFDLDESIGFLQQYPLDLRNWAVQNSHRRDIELLPANFRGQTTGELLPLGEIPLYRHNGKIFSLDSHGNGETIISAGDVWLLPYWMGRYLGIISPPENF
jgi:hypothetical protein